MDFISDKCDQKIKTAISKYDLPVVLISKPAKFLFQCFTENNLTARHVNCDICDQLPDKFRCEDRFIVYEYSCKVCLKRYIGQTCRPFYVRYQEHKSSINSKNDKSALSDHFLTDHLDRNMSINDFNVSFLRKLENPLHTKLSEAILIDVLRPELNRKDEMACW